jgi:transglutaminase-like putative cysteine protease
MDTRQAEWEFAIEAAGGADRQRGVRFLLEHMNIVDRTSMPVFVLLENVALAYQARDEFPWGAALPENMFWEYVLPYCVFDERRDEWRTTLHPLCSSVVAEATDIHNAAELLNTRIWDLLNVHYSTERRAPNQCVSESMELGKASCTGLSILLVNALRAVGIAARAVGTPLWAKGSGNHTWVEYYDCASGKWCFTGAAEQDPTGCNRGWFFAEASRASPLHPIFATSYARRVPPTFFPMVSLFALGCKH